MRARIVISTCEHDHGCPGRRVLTEGDFELVDNVDEKWLYLVTDEVHLILNALVGGEQ